MAAASCEAYSYEVLNPFEVLIGQITQELTSIDVKVAKSVIIERIDIKDFEQIDVNKPCSAAQLISIFRKDRLLSSNNLGLLKDLLKLLKCEALLAEVEKFENSEKIVSDASVAQIDMIHEAGTFVNLYLVISCKKENLSDSKIRELQGALKSLSNPSHQSTTPEKSDQSCIVYLHSSENESDKDTTVVIFQFPKNQNEKSITEKLQNCALNKDKWLVDNGVIQLKVNGKSSINLKESLEFKMKDIEDDVYLARKPELPYPTKNVVDIILVVEMPHSVTPHVCKEVIKMCHSAVQDLNVTSKFDVNLAIIQYGNHTDSTSGHVHLLQGFCKEYDVKSELKNSGQIGSENGGNSGMADALFKVVELTNSSSARPDAAKLCVLIAFPTKTKTLDHYRSHNNNDVFEVTNTLARCKIPLYIIGADDGGSSSNPSYSREELFLSGLAHVGGGRYFRIVDDNKLIGDVVKHDVSIENQEETVGELVKDAINHHFGDTNETRLAEDVLGNARFKSSMFVQLLQNGRSLEPISQTAKRVALSDDLDDAIKALDRIEQKKSAEERGNTRGCAFEPTQLKPRSVVVDDPGDGEFHCSRPDTKAYKPDPIPTPQEKVDVGKLSKDVQEKVVVGKIYSTADLEMVTRMVKRHLYRMAYYKKQH